MTFYGNIDIIFLFYRLVLKLALIRYVSAALSSNFSATTQVIQSSLSSMCMLQHWWIW